MGLFKSAYEKDLDRIIARVEMNMSNNYKDAAQEDFAELLQAFEAYTGEKKLDKKAREHYETVISVLSSRLQGFTHKDQKPYWQ